MRGSPGISAVGSGNCAGRKSNGCSCMRNGRGRSGALRFNSVDGGLPCPAAIRDRAPRGISPCRSIAASAHLERCGHVEYLLAVLNGDHAPLMRSSCRRDCGRLHTRWDDRDRRRAKNSVQRMHLPAFDSRIRRRQRLPQHLPAEHATPAGIAALAAKQIDFQSLQLATPAADRRAADSLNGLRRRPGAFA